MTDHECWRIGRFAIDILALFLAFLPFILLTGVGAQPFQRGFFCDDESIRYPHKPDSVSLASMYQGTILISTAIILLVEMTRYIYSKCTANEPGEYSVTPYCSVPSIVFLLYRVLGSMYFGFAVVLSLVDVGKYSSGRLKPSFFSVCKPDPASYNCTSSGDSGPSVFVENYRCQETNMATLSRARQSFPTLHTTLTHYFAAYLLIYLQVRLTWKPIRMLRHVLQAGCYAAAIYVSISRVGDNAHFFSDVIVSVVLGNVIGILVVLFVCRILQLAAQEMKLRQQEVTVTAAAGVDVRPVFEVPKSADANLPVYNLYPNPSGGGNIYSFQGNGGGFATAYSPVQMQQQSGMFSNFGRYS